MKNVSCRLLLLLFFPLFYLEYAFTQTSLNSKIVLKDKTVINNIKVWNIYSNKIEYEEKESLHDLLTERIARIETDTAILSFDESGGLYSRPYDWIIKSNDDTVYCVISQLGGNYIYYFPKGKENRSYLPETSVKKYQVFKPLLVQKPEAGSSPYSAQPSLYNPVQDSSSSHKNERMASITPDTSAILPHQPEKITEFNKDSIIAPAEPKGEPFAKKKEENASSPVTGTGDLCYESYIKGERDANRKNESLWGTGSFCLNFSSCFTLGLPTSIITLIAVKSKQKPGKIPEGVEERCYTLGYKNQQTKRRIYNVSVGGIVSSVVLIAAVYTFYIMQQAGM